MKRVAITLGITERGVAMNVRNEYGSLVRHIGLSTPAEYGQLFADIESAIHKEGPVNVTSVAAGITGTISRGRLKRCGLGWDGRNLAHGLRRLGTNNIVVLPAASMGAIGEYSVLDKAQQATTKVAYVDWGQFLIAATTANGTVAHIASLDHAVVTKTPTPLPCICGQQEDGHLDAHLGGRHIEDRFDAPFPQIKADKWDVITNELVQALRHLIDQTGCTRIILTGFMTKRLVGFFGHQGIQDSLHAHFNGAYRHVEVMAPLCGNSILRGAQLMAPKLALE